MPTSRQKRKASRHTMKESEILPAVLAGNKLAVGEFRDWEAGESYDDAKKKWNAREKFFVVVGRESVPIVRFADDGKRKADLSRPALKSGDKCVVQFSLWQRNKYGLEVRGSVEPLLKG